MVGEPALVADGWSAEVVLGAGERGPYGNDVVQLSVEVVYETKERVRFKIFDPSHSRFEVPQFDPALIFSGPGVTPLEALYEVSYTRSPFGLAVTRKLDGALLFNSTPPESETFNGLIFSNQFLEMSSQVPDADPTLFGIAQHRTTFRLPVGTGNHFTGWGRDKGGTPEHEATGGTRCVVTVLLC